MTADDVQAVPPPTTPSRLPLWAKFADIATLGALWFWYWVFETAGLRHTVWGVRISVRSHVRVLVVVLFMLGVRHLLVRRPPFLAWAVRDIWNWPTTPSRLPCVSPPARWWQGAWGALALVFAVWVVMTWPQVTGMNRLVYDPGDPLMKVWQLSWVAHQLARAPLHLYDANIFYPEIGTLAYTDAMIAPSLVAAPFLWLGVPAVLAFNLLMAAGMILSGVAMFALVRCLTGCGPAAAFAALAFAFLPYRFNHYAHLELQFTWGIPLALWALHRVCETGKLRDGLLVGLAVGLQAACSLYYGAFLGVFVALVGIVLWRGSPHRADSAGALAAGALLAGVCALFVVLPHVANRGSVGERSMIDVRIYSATPASYLAPDANNRLYRATLGRFGAHEKQLFPGFLLMGLALVGVRPLRSIPRLAYLAGALLAFDASLGSNGLIYPALFHVVPPFRGFRVPARFGVLTATALVVLAGYGAAWILARPRTRAVRTVLATSLAVILLVEFRSFPLPLFAIPGTQPQVYRWLATRPPTVIAELPVTDADDFWYMYHSRFHWHSLLNGQSGFFPAWYNDFQRFSNQFPDAVSIAYLKSRGVRHVVLHEDRYQRDAWRQVEVRLAAYGHLIAPVATFAGEGVRVVELR